MLRNIEIKSVKVRGRTRKDMGDLQRLADSIEAIGLLHPIVVDREHKLVAGERRLRAYRLLKSKPTTIPANVVNNLNEVAKLLAAERDENTCRKEFTTLEAVAMGKRLEELEKPKAKQRRKETQGRPQKTGGKKPPVNGSPKKTRDRVGEQVGMSGRTYEKAKEVAESGDKEAIEQMERTGKVGPAYNRMKQNRKKKELEEKAKKVEEMLPESKRWLLIDGDVNDILHRLDTVGRPWDDSDTDLARLVFTDPPYNVGVDYGNGKLEDKKPDAVYLAWCESWMRGIWDSLTDDGSFWLMVSDEYAAELCCKAKGVGFTMRSWIKWFEGFGVNCTNNFNRTTRHIFWFIVDPKHFVFNTSEVMRPSDRQTKYNDKRAAGGGKMLNDMWDDIPRLQGTTKERMPGFPTQLPVALVERIVLCASEPGDLVIDPFNGSGTTGAAAVTNGRKYIGIDHNEEYIDAAHKRLTVL